MHHFGVLVPSTNTIVEMEYGQLLPSTLQVHGKRQLVAAQAARVAIWTASSTAAVR